MLPSRGAIHTLGRFGGRWAPVVLAVQLTPCILPNLTRRKHLIRVNLYTHCVFSATLPLWRQRSALVIAPHILVPAFEPFWPRLNLQPLVLCLANSRAMGVCLVARYWLEIFSTYLPFSNIWHSQLGFTLGIINLSLGAFIKLYMGFTCCFYQPHTKIARACVHCVFARQVGWMNVYTAAHQSSSRGVLSFLR